MTTIPLLDVAGLAAPVKEDVLADIADVIDSGAFILGPAVDRFELAFADGVGTSYCVGMSSGLDALRIALRAAGIERGAEVIVPANTFIASFAAITQAGAVPVPVDVRTSDYNIDPEAVSAALTERTQAIVPVHLYGQMADMQVLQPLADRAGIKVIEDACQAHGAVRDGRTAGTLGIAGSYSFYPGKVLGAFGDAGALVTDSPAVRNEARSLRDHGQVEKHVHTRVGYTARLDTLQAIVLLRKLPLLPGELARRRAVADQYSERLGSIGDIRIHPVPAGSAPAWHLYEIRTSHRDSLARFLERAGIETGLHYPIPPHVSPAYADLGLTAGSFPVTERLASELLSIPMFPGLSREQIDLVVSSIETYFREEAGRPPTPTSTGSRLSTRAP